MFDLGNSASPPPLIIEHTNFTQHTYLSWLPTSLSLVSASLVLSFGELSCLYDDCLGAKSTSDKTVRERLALSISYSLS